MAQQNPAILNTTTTTNISDDDDDDDETCCTTAVATRSFCVQVGRRYKITNPEKFRDFYGKMMYILQDAQAQGRVGLNLVNNIQVWRRKILNLCCLWSSSDFTATQASSSSLVNHYSSRQ